MTTRVLPVQEWDRLAGTDTASVFEVFGPDEMTILVLEDGDRLIGACAVLHVPWIEGAWIDPTYRGWGSLRALLSAAWQWVPGRWVMTSALDAVRARQWRRLGAVELPGTHLMFAKGEPRICRHWPR